MGMFVRADLSLLQQSGEWVVADSVGAASVVRVLQLPYGLLLEEMNGGKGASWLVHPAVGAGTGLAHGALLC